MQVARIKQTTEKVLDTYSAERILRKNLFCDQGITIISVLTAFKMSITTIALASTGLFEGGSDSGCFSPKDEGILKKWLIRLADAFKTLAGRADDTLPAIVGNVIGPILSFLGKTIGFVAKYKRTSIVFVVGFIGGYG